MRANERRARAEIESRIGREERENGERTERGEESLNPPPRERRA